MAVVNIECAFCRAPIPFFTGGWCIVCAMPNWDDSKPELMQAAWRFYEYIGTVIYRNFVTRQRRKNVREP